MGVECKLDQRALDGDEVDTRRWNGHARAGIGGVRSLNGNRCMLVARGGQSHDRYEGKCSTG